MSISTDTHSNNVNSDKMTNSMTTSENSSDNDAVLVTASSVTSNLTLSPTETVPDNQDLSEHTLRPLMLDTIPFPPSPGERPFMIANAIAQATHLDNLCQITVTQLRKHLATDRALIYKFHSETQGTVVAESLTSGYTPYLGESVTALAFGAETIQDYQQQPFVSIGNLAEEATTPYQVQLCQHFQVQAYVSLPIFLDEQLWGLLVIQSCTAPRQWTESDIALLYQIGTEFSLRLHVHELRLQHQQEATRDRIITSVVKDIRQLSDLQAIFEKTVQAIRQHLHTDRVAIFKFHPGSNNGSGEIIAESVGKRFVSAKEVHVEDHCFDEGGKTDKDYRQGGYWVTADIHNAGLPECHLNTLTQFQVRANLVVPLLKEGKLWGLFCIHQCDGPRIWKDDEIGLVRRIAARLDVALQQTTYLEQLQTKNYKLTKIAGQERLITQIAERLRRSTDIPQVLKTSVRDIRQLLKADRVGLFQFDIATNYSVGEFVIEDVSAETVSAMATRVKDHCFAEDQAENYRNGREWIVHDIQDLDLPTCLIDLLTQLQVRASLVIPLLKGDVLWGLFCIHQCQGPRHWQGNEIDFARRIGLQLNVALQQAEYLEQLQEKNTTLTAAAADEKASKERIQQQVSQLLSDVYPALGGDLTVRAPVTDTEVGTVASAYNNTLQSLQKIVLEVKQAAEQVGQTSQMSGTSMVSLNQQAQRQAAALDKTLAQVKEMMSSTEAVANDAQHVETAVQQANLTIQTGDAAMNNTVASIMEIRSTVADTSQRIKRLSESSQKISKVVNLISHFTSQTQLLSLNASIEATRAGEYGRGFAVVADEVRSLARQSAQAATEIEQLVQEIQVGTAEVSTAMEMGIQQVAKGTTLVTDTRQNLTAIVEATSQISRLIEGITQITHQQVSEFKDVTGTVNEATEIANQTSAESEQLTQSIHQLLATAEALQASTDKFKVA
ncbi:MAG: GAF domain-containing protein [Leptolyngbyaceae cyanobacterium]